MGFFTRFGANHITVDEPTADRLAQPSHRFLTTRIQPPYDTQLPATLPRFIQGITEYQTKLLGIKNTSPTIGFEIQRFTPVTLHLQFITRSSRVDRKLRTHLAEQIPNIRFDDGTSKLPLTSGDSVGVGILSLRRKDIYPVATAFDRPPTNSVVTPLHRHAMRDSRILIQLLFKPVAGHPVTNRRWQRDAARESKILRTETVGFLPWNDRDPTPREKQQARRIDDKAGSPRFQVAIRILVVGAADYTGSRIKEVAGGLNIFGDTETGQSFQTRTVRSLRNTPIRKTVTQIRDRSFSHSFQLSLQELAALITIPDRDQDNLMNP